MQFSKTRPLKSGESSEKSSGENRIKSCHVSGCHGFSAPILGLETARWGAGLSREGVVAKKFVPSLQSLSSLGFEERNLGCPGNFAGVCRTPGVVRKVVHVHFFCSLIWTTATILAW